MRGLLLSRVEAQPGAVASCLVWHHVVCTISGGAVIRRCMSAELASRLWRQHAA